MLCRQLLLDLYAPLKGIEDRTIELYGFTLDAYSESLGHECAVEDFDELLVARFLSARKRTHAAATVAKDRSQLRALWEFAARRGLTPTFPTIALVKIPERIPEAWLTEDMVAILASCDKEQTTIADIPSRLWWRAIVLLAYETGERITPILSLPWSNVVGCTVMFRAESRKNKTRDIRRGVSVECADALWAIKQGRSGDQLVFPWDRGHTYIWGRLGIILERAGMPHNRYCKFHRIRKTTASYFEAGGGNAQRLLDHADPATTRKYLDPRIVKTPQACDLLPSVFSHYQEVAGAACLNSPPPPLARGGMASIKPPHCLRRPKQPQRDSECSRRAPMG